MSEKYKIKFNNFPLFPFRYVAGPIETNEPLDEIEVPVEIYARLCRWYEELYDINHEILSLVSHKACQSAKCDLHRTQGKSNLTLVRDV